MPHKAPAYPPNVARLQWSSVQSRQKNQEPTVYRPFQRHNIADDDVDHLEDPTASNTLNGTADDQPRHSLSCTT